MLPTVDFCGLNVTRLIIGANPFGGYSHQNKNRDEEMRTWHSVDRIHKTWQRAESAGINTMIANNETPHVLEAVRTYLSSGGKLQWIAQVNRRQKTDVLKAIDEAIEIGCKGIYFHGALLDAAYEKGDAGEFAKWVEHARAAGVPAGTAGHLAKAHLWIDEQDIVDFHAVCFFNCGSLHDGKGERFRLADVAKAVDAIQRIQKPCIGYKIMGSGRMDPRMAFEYAFESIKPTDAVNVGMHRGDKDDMVEENVGIVNEFLGELVAT